MNSSLKFYEKSFNYDKMKKNSRNLLDIRLFTGNCTQPSSGVVSTPGSTPSALSDLPRYPWMALTGGNYTVFSAFLLLLFSLINFFRFLSKISSDFSAKFYFQISIFPSFSYGSVAILRCCDCIRLWNVLCSSLFYPKD